MDKTSIKIIKRKDAAIAASVKTRNLRQSKQAAVTVSEEKIERGLHRKMADTVSDWIAERRENKRVEEVSAFRTLFGEEFLTGRLA